ncbi:hypothetical protein IPA_07460 [Ignicoccus pacificus DSM 13166]|uniref:YdbS-like PH domain-containing protein n=1 Tax=Ignicoccus pacificus DSM 13166 TaxID=940294 RepID=A0A977KD32_9CREN|nr:hypothetical protein IPA_07460 [Ignicoccus pacificus DSM 13166]
MEVKPTVKAYLGEIAILILSILGSIAAPLFPQQYQWFWYAIPIALIIISFFISKRAFVLALIALVPGAVGYYFSKYFAMVTIPIALVELYLLFKYISSIRYIIKEDGVTVSVDFIFMSSTRTIPKDSISELQVNTGPLGKILGYADIEIKLKNKGEIKIDGVPKDAADKVRKMLIGSA